MYRRFIHRHTFRDPKDSVHALAFSSHAKFLAAAGMSGLYVWHTKTHLGAPVPLRYCNVEVVDEKHVMTAILWLYFEGSERHMLVLGGLLGDLVALSWNEARQSFEHAGRALPNTNQTQIISMNCQAQTIESGGAARIAICYANKSVATWKIDSTGDITKLYSVTLPSMTTISTHFNSKGQVLAFGQHGGDMALLNEATGDTIWQKKIPDQQAIHDVVIDEERDRMVLSTGRDYRVYSLSETKPLHVLKNDLASLLATVPKRIAFTGDRKLVIVGTDRGEAVLFSVEEGIMKRKFKYPRGGLVQTVAGYSDQTYDYVAIAGSTQEWESDVIFHSKYKASLFAWPKAPSQTVCSWFILVVAALALLVMNLLVEVEFRSPVSWRPKELSMVSSEILSPSASSWFRKTEWL
ncbi:hypothetical protein V5O48_019115 [Marasmius crinis-equi]|uniref:WD40 repeat-like protein n=1 Tax=Marasmius crinis-equi TaxID=585013 RepID=A0ABR3EJA4_9AGAR